MFNIFFTAWRMIIIIIADEFSLLQLLRTFFAPWKRDTAPLVGSLDQIFRTILENLMSRLMGFIIRLFTIIVCLIVELAVLILGAFAFILFLISSPFLAFLFRAENFPPLNPADNPKNLIAYLDQEARAICEGRKKYSDSRRIIFILNHMGVAKESFAPLENQFAQINTDRLISEAAKITAQSQDKFISPASLFYGAYLLDPLAQEFFSDYKIKKEDMENLYIWERAFYNTVNRPSILFHPENYRSRGGVGRSWSSGYTVNLDRFSYEIGAHISSLSPLHFEAHKKNIDELETILGRSIKHNVILVGEPGTGKRTMILGFAQRVLFGQTIPSLAHRRVIELNIDAVLSGREAEKGLFLMLNEAVRAGNIILFIEDVHRLFKSLDISGILIPYLRRSDFQLIGTTTYKDYHQWIFPNQALANNLEKIEIKEPGNQEVLKMLKEVALYSESRYKILIPYQSLKELVKLADRYLPERRFPGKAVDLLDECCSYLVNQKREKVLYPEDIAQIVTMKTEIPVGEVELSEKEKLLKLEEEFHQRLVNQNEAVRLIADSLRRSRAGLGTKNKPIGAFLFLGPTGVGKTECAKTLARVYYGNEKNMIRFDMSEFQQTEAISRFIGGANNAPGLLTSKVRENPFSLILLDEIEKAHPNILNLFLQIFDEGQVRDFLGQTVDFKNSIIIATSNAGSEWIRNQVKEKRAVNREELLEYLLQNKVFRPEFLNRFDAAVAFRPLTLEELEKVTEILIAEMQEQVQEKQITIKLEPGARRKLAELGFDPQFGARALSRVIQDKVGNQIARAILEDKLSSGSVFTISEKEIGDGSLLT